MRRALLAFALAAASACFGADRKLSAVIVDGLNNHDWAAGTNAIRAVLDDPARRAELIERGDARAAELSWKRTAAATVEVYRELL